MDRSSRQTPEYHATVWNPSVWSDERICLLGALAVAAFVVYASLVPFDFRRPDTLDPGAWIEQIKFTPWSQSSSTDFLVNATVGVPLGLLLMGVLCAERRLLSGSAAVAVLTVGSLSALLGTAVESLQVLSPTRQSSWNDVLAQSLGAGVGALGWNVVGARVISWLRQLRSERQPSEFSARLLQLYLPIYLLIQLTPFSTRAGELTASAYPFASTFLVLRNLAGNALINIPIGTLAVLGWVPRDRRRSLGRAVLLGILFVAAVSLARDLVWSRHSGSADLFAGMLGLLIGIAAARIASRPGDSDSVARSGLVHPWLLVAAGAWTLVLIGQSWNPFDLELTRELAKDRFVEMSVVPIASYGLYAANPLPTVHDMLLKFLLAVPLGLLLRMASRIAGDPRVRRRQAVVTFAVALTVLLGIEIGQMFLPMRLPDVTDVLIGAIGALAGIATATAFARRQSTVAYIPTLRTSRRFAETVTESSL